jgi:hypothetical protein
MSWASVTTASRLVLNPSWCTPYCRGLCYTLLVTDRGVVISVHGDAGCANNHAPGRDAFPPACCRHAFDALPPGLAAERGAPGLVVGRRVSHRHPTSQRLRTARCRTHDGPTVSKSIVCHSLWTPSCLPSASWPASIIQRNTPDGACLTFVAKWHPHPPTPALPATTAALLPSSIETISTSTTTREKLHSSDSGGHIALPRRPPERGSRRARSPPADRDLDEVANWHEREKEPTNLQVLEQRQIRSWFLPRDRRPTTRPTAALARAPAWS